MQRKKRMFNKDSVRDMLCNLYFVSKIRYRGMPVLPSQVSYRSTPPQVSDGQHEPSSPRSCVTADRRCGLDGVLSQNPDKRRPGFCCCEARRPVHTVVNDFVPRDRKMSPLTPGGFTPAWLP